VEKIELYPFTKISWRSNEIKEEWEPIKKRIYDATYFAEYESVKRGLRPCDVYQLDPDKFDIQIKKVFLDQLHFLPILRSRRYSGFGHRHYMADKIDENTFIYGVVSNDLLHAIRFHDAGVVDLNQRLREWTDMNPNGIDHDITGELLGYPPCDRDFFNEYWLKGGNLDPEYEIAQNTGGTEIRGDPALNRMIRYFGFNIIPFFPHSFNCYEASKFADWWGDLMYEYDEEATGKLYEALSMPMTWSLQNCIIYVEHPLFIGSANGYYTEKKKVVKWLGPA